MPGQRHGRRCATEAMRRHRAGRQPTKAEAAQLARIAAMLPPAARVVIAAAAVLGGLAALQAPANAPPAHRYHYPCKAHSAPPFLSYTPEHDFMAGLCQLP